MSFKTSQEVVFISGSTELYEVDFGDHVEYYTIKPNAVDFGTPTHTYTPLPINRGEVRRNPELAADELEILLPLNTSMTKYLGDGAPGMIEVRIYRGFGDPETQPGNYKLWFTGVLKTAKWVRESLQITLTSKDYLLFSAMLPRVRYSPTCNNELYGPVCRVIKANYTGTFRVNGLARANTQLSLEPTDPFALAHFKDCDTDNGDGTVIPGYFTLGKAWEDGYEGGVRHVVSHQWVDPQLVCTIELHTPIPELAVNDIVKVSAGCNKEGDTCVSKFNNFNNLVRFKRVPSKNPVQTGFIPYYSE